MRVRHEIAMHAGCDEQLSQHVRMTFGRGRRPYRLSREPSRHALPRGGHWHGRPDYTRIRHKPEIPEQACPRQTNGSGAIELIIEPLPGCLILRKSGDARINEHVDVNQYHLNPSPSA